MKNVSSLNNTKTESPKTPGGISKSLLTPCRRVGLSRNWRKTGPSPFISPLADNSKEQNKNETKKRKERCEDENSGLIESKHDENMAHDREEGKVDNNAKICEDIVTTPLRNISLPRRKKSKISSLNTDNISEPRLKSTTCDSEVKDEDNKNNSHLIQFEEINKSASKTPRKKNCLRTMSVVKERENSSIETKEEQKVNDNKQSATATTENISIVKKSPENLTKECIVVIQQKMFKKDLLKLNDSHSSKQNVNIASQVLFDSDSDEVPLSLLHKATNKQNSPLTHIVCEDDDFEEVKVVKKLEDKTTSTGGLKSKPDKKRSKPVNKVKVNRTAYVVPCIESKPSSQSSYDDDDDDDFINVNRKTILIRKAYNKITQPTKAKSTGSITQKDIDDLKVRIEMKKKMLLAKSMGHDTKELRDLIKKWQRGCQDALMELMELMKKQLPDKQNMAYSEILKTLKIPSDLVGYDEENDCFNTPSDENIILSKYDV